eukprot:81545_1
MKFNRFGISLKDQLINGNEGDLQRYVFSEGGFYYHNELYPNGSDHITTPKARDWPRAEEEDSTGSPRCVLIKDLNYKLVYRPLGVSEFYDLTKDPREITNLYGVTNNITYLNEINKMMYNLTAWYVLT